jgi:hypothetical protein
MIISDLFFVANFPPFAKTIFKKEYSATNSLEKKIRQKYIHFTKNCHNYLQHERVLKSFVFYFHILNIAKLSKIFLQAIVIWAMSQN